MSKDKEKKKFRDTKLGKFLLEKVPKAAGVIGDLLPDKGLLGVVKNIIDGEPSLAAEDRLQLQQMLQDFEKEMYALEIQDRDSARNREIEIAKTGRTDHLMYVSGYVALASFLGMVITVIYASIEKIEIENALFHQLMGIVEAVAFTVFGYYFGASKSSKTKVSTK